jgi:hypothetical protein
VELLLGDEERYGGLLKKAGEGWIKGAYLLRGLRQGERSVIVAELRKGDRRVSRRID